MQREETKQIEQFIATLADHMQIPCQVAVTTDEAGAVHVAIQASEEGRLLIG